MHSNDQKPASLFKRAAALFTGVGMLALSAVPAFAETMKPSASAMGAYNSLKQHTPQNQRSTQAKPSSQAPCSSKQAPTQMSTATKGTVFWNIDGERTQLVDFTTMMNGKLVEATLEYNHTTQRGIIDSKNIGVGAPFSLDQNNNIVVDTSRLQGDPSCSRGDPSCTIVLHNLANAGFGVSNEDFMKRRAGYTLPDGHNGRAFVPSGGFVDSYTVEGQTYVVYTRRDHAITVSTEYPDPINPRGVDRVRTTFELQQRNNFNIVATAEQGYEQIKRDRRNPSQQFYSPEVAIQLRIAQNLALGFAADASSHPYGRPPEFEPQTTGRFTYRVDGDAAALWGIPVGTEFPLIDAAVINPYNGYPVIDPGQTGRLDQRGLGRYIHKNLKNMEDMARRFSATEKALPSYAATGANKTPSDLGIRMRDYARPKPLDFKS